VARLATVRPDATPHLVPVTFAVVGNALVIAIDSKPKRTRDLQRLRNLRANPAVSLLVDHYSDDWTQLWWLRIDGRADIVEPSDASDGVDALVAKYPPYRDARPDGPFIVIHPDRWTYWAAQDGRASQ
jgi:PPOX class probable F420-dependent enzyme